MRWKIKQINGIHICTTSLISQDHVKLDSSIITNNIVHLVKTNPGIKIKTLIANMLQRFGYIVTYKKTWTTKQKVLEIAFESWEESYSCMLKWTTTTQHFIPGTIVRCKTSNSIKDGEDDSSKVIFNNVFGLLSHALKTFNITSQLCKWIIHF